MIDGQGQPSSDRQLCFSSTDRPIKSRKSTDVLFSLLFSIAVISMNLLGLAATGVIRSSLIKRGDPLRLIRGIDYKGNICGVDDSVKSLKKKWMVSSSYGICVESCPGVGEVRQDSYNDLRNWTSYVKTINVMGYCLPVDSKRVEAFGNDMFADFIQALAPITVMGFLMSTLLSLLFIMFAWVPLVLRLSVWISICFVFAVLVSGAYSIQENALQEQHNGALSQGYTQIVLLKCLGAGLAIGAVLWLSLVFMLRQRIALAISIVREATKALISMPSLMFFPCLQAILFLGASALWLVYSVYLISSGSFVTKVERNTGIQYFSFQIDRNSERALGYMAFCWVWIIGFLEAQGSMAVSHAILIWYFYPKRKGAVYDEDSYPRASVCQLAYSYGIMFRYHNGTAALGSLLLALFQMLRLFLEYMKVRLLKHNARTQSVQTSPTGSAVCSSLLQFVFCSVSCCLYCFDKFLQFLSKHAFTQCAMHGTPFFTSAHMAFSLILRNVGRLSVVSVIIDFVVFVGKLSVTLCCAGVAYYYFANVISAELRGIVMPVLLVSYLAFRTSTLFLGTISSASYTILHAFLLEMEDEVVIDARESDLPPPTSNPFYGVSEEMTTAVASAAGASAKNEFPNMMMCVAELKEAGEDEYLSVDSIPLVPLIDILAASNSKEGDGQSGVFIENDGGRVPATTHVKRARDVESARDKPPSKGTNPFTEDDDSESAGLTNVSYAANKSAAQMKDAGSADDVLYSRGSNPFTDDD